MEACADWIVEQHPHLQRIPHEWRIALKGTLYHEKQQHYVAWSKAHYQYAIAAQFRTTRHNGRSSQTYEQHEVKAHCNTRYTRVRQSTTVDWNLLIYQCPVRVAEIRKTRTWLGHTKVLQTLHKLYPKRRPDSGTASHCSTNVRLCVWHTKHTHHTRGTPSVRWQMHEQSHKQR